jgi:acyl-CoA hydrolase
MEVGIKVIAENIQTQEKRHVNSCFFTMVAVDEHGQKRAVPPLELNDDDQRRRSAQAVHRRALRRELDARFDAANP